MLVLGGSIKEGLSFCVLLFGLGSFLLELYSCFLIPTLHGRLCPSHRASTYQAVNWYSSERSQSSGPARGFCLCRDQRRKKSQKRKKSPSLISTMEGVGYIFSGPWKGSSSLPSISFHCLSSLDVSWLAWTPLDSVLTMRNHTMGRNPNLRLKVMELLWGLVLLKNCSRNF